MPENKSWLQFILEAEIERKWEHALKRSNKLQEMYPNMDPDELVNLEINDKALWAGFIGIGTGGLESIPAVGQAIAVSTIVPEAVYLAKMQVDIMLIMIFIYQKDIAKEDIKPFIITCFVLAMGSDFIKKNIIKSAVNITRETLLKIIGRMEEKQIISVISKIGIKASADGILAKTPVISIVLNASMNYTQIHAFGWVAKKFLSPSFIICENCGFLTGKLNNFCPQCGSTFQGN